MDAPDGFTPFDPLGPFLELVGPVLVRDDDDGPVFGLRVEERHTNHRGTVQGGLLSTFVDSEDVRQGANRTDVRSQVVG